MASLAGQTIKDKYIALLKTSDNGDLSANSGASAVNITDGIGTATALSLSTNRVGIGTISPTIDLDVVGSIKASGTGKVYFNTANTGIGSSTVNELDVFSYEEMTLTTGANNANILLIPHGTGKVGIGADDPSVELEVDGDIAVQATDKIYLDGGDDTYIDEIAANVMCFNTNGYQDFYISSGQINSQYNVNGNETFGINYTGYQGGTTQFRDVKIYDGKQSLIAFFDGSSGNVGIGASSPGNYHSSARNFVIESNILGGMTIANTGGHNGGIYFADGAGTGDEEIGRIIYQHSDDSLRISTAGDEQMIIDADGNVGIGTDDPDTLLDVNGHILGGLKVNSASYIAIQRNDAIVGGMNTYTGVFNLFAGTDTEAQHLIIRASGKVGIGEATPTAQLHIDQASASGAVPVLKLDQADTDDSFIDFIGTSSGASANSISSSTATASAKFGAIRIEINGVHKWIRVYDTAV